MNIDTTAVGNRIAELRRQSGLTQQQLSSILCVSHQAVSKWEKGQSLPDLQTLLDMTEFFGCTVEQIISENRDNNTDKTQAPEIGQKETNMMNFQQLMQMAPFMSKDAVEEIVSSMDVKLSGAQIARLAPFVRTECVDMLVEKHHPEMNWDTLRRIAPHMSQEAVDKLARQVASGERTVRTPDDDINKTIDDIGKAFDDLGKGVGKTFDDIGKGVDKAVRKAVKFGGNVISEISSAISELSAEPTQDVPVAPKRSEQAMAIRKKAFERALEDGRWEWLGAHIGEIEDDQTLKASIIAKAREENMHAWICTYMGGYADDTTIEAAIGDGNWSWLGENAASFAPHMQQKVALAAMQAENWEWLSLYAQDLQLDGCAYEIAETAMKAGAAMLAAQLAEQKLTQEDVDRLAEAACAAGDFDTLDLLAGLVSRDMLTKLLTDLANLQNWDRVQAYMAHSDAETAGKLAETALEQGNFDALDMLDKYL